VEAQEIEALAMVGATTIVAAMATDAWATARDRAAQLFQHRGPDRPDRIEAQLDANAALFAGARDAGRARLALVGSWRLELEGLLATHPDSGGQLEALIAEIRTALPAAQRQWVQHNTARENAVLNVVQYGTQNNNYMDAPPPRLRPATGPGTGES
jgi:hypothetical protein